MKRLELLYVLALVGLSVLLGIPCALGFHDAPRRGRCPSCRAVTRRWGTT